MTIKANTIASQIIMRHMNGELFDKNQYQSDIKCTVELYDNQNNNLLKNIKEKVDLKQNTYIKDNSIYLIYDGTFNHLGVNKIVLRDNLWLNTNQLLQKTILAFSVVFIFMAIVGYFLGRLFLKPILIQRNKLDLFIKDTTHELNTPITALLMSVNKKNPNEDKNLKRINISAKRISEIYSDLTYLFLETNAKPIQLLNLKDIIEEDIEYFLELSHKKKIDIVCDFEDISYNIDKESFKRLTNNLISNAIKYTNINGHIQVILKNNIFIVKDDGIGIAKDKQKDIFERFYRATTNSGGFGIGLHIVSSICQKYNIKIEFQSKQNIGTEFKLLFNK
jgi:two-component system OmpR family sensor kinase